MKKAMIFCLMAALLMCPLLTRAELTAFEPVRTEAFGALPADDAGRAAFAACLLSDCLASEAVPTEANQPDGLDCRLLSTESTVCVLFSAGERTLALYYGLEAHNAGWDAVDTPLTDELVERLAQSMGAQVWPVDAALATETDGL